MMFYTDGTHPLVARIENVELRRMGQANQVGKYPINFNMAGDASDSYVKSNSIWNSYNRAIVMKGTSYLTVFDNVASDIKGHAFLFEDAVEEYNTLEHNLAVNVQQCWSCLVTDQTPAGFLITNPKNYFINNRVAGSAFYGFWFDTQETPIGSHTHVEACPEHEPLGSFTGNEAHSNGEYGLRVFHNMFALQNPCLEWHETDNPSITSELISFKGWRNQVNGIIASYVGDFIIKDFTVAENIVAGIEFEKVISPNWWLNANGEQQESLQDVRAENGVIIAKSDYGDILSDGEHSVTKPRGIITPRTEGFHAKGLSFFSFDTDSMAAIGTCSHCFKATSTDSGARTVLTEDLWFDSVSSDHKIKYGYPYKAIINDLDGSLTNRGAGSWATPNFKFNGADHPECDIMEDIYDGLTCSNNVEVRRVSFYGATPWDKFRSWPAYFGRINGDQTLDQLNGTDLDAFVDVEGNFGSVPYKWSLDPVRSWTAPFVTDSSYFMWTGNRDDFDWMQISITNHTKPGDKALYMFMDHLDQREKIDVFYNGDATDPAPQEPVYENFVGDNDQSGAPLDRTSWEFARYWKSDENITEQ